MNKFAFVDCTTVDQALAELKDGAVIKAGGIDLLDLMKDGIVTPPRLVNIRNVNSLHGIRASAEGLHLGPLSTLSEIAEHPVIQREYSALSDAAGHAATPQVRNMTPKYRPDSMLPYLKKESVMITVPLAVSIAIANEER